MTIANPCARRKKEAGYTLLMVVFMVATILIAAAAVTPNLGTEGRREKEAEMVWRGQQYERAIGLYYKKFGKYPTKIEDLTKQTNGVRFLRQAYTDPMNKDDGSWRFIYVGPNGQLIGSLRPASMLPVAVSTQGPGPSPFTVGGSQGLPQLGGMGQQTGIGVPGQPASSASTPNPLDSQPQPLTGAVLGGAIIGVGSKIKKPSLRVYMGGDDYQHWEFIYSTNGQIILPGQTPVSPNGIPGSAPTGANSNGIGASGAPQNGTDPNAPGGQQPPPIQPTPIVNVPPSQ